MEEIRRIILDGQRMKTRAEAHGHIKSEMNFPNYYGNNLDALWDMLTEIRQRTNIVIIHSEYITEKLGKYGNMLLNTFLEASEENDRIYVESDSKINGQERNSHEHTIFFDTEK